MIKYKYLYIDGKKTDYAVSNDGNVVSINYNHTKLSKLMTVQYDKNGYRKVHLTLNNKHRNFRIARLVAMTFIPIPDRYLQQGYRMEDLQVNHIDGNKQNDNVNNLEWCTGKENVIHAELNNLRHHLKGEDHPMVKHDVSMIHTICELLSQNTLSISEISEKLNAPFWLVYAIAKEGAWEDIASQHNVKNYNVKPNHRKNCILRMYDDDTVLQIARLLEEGGHTMKEIAELTNTLPSYVEKIKYKLIHQDLTKDFSFKIRKMKKRKKGK